MTASRKPVVSWTVPQAPLTDANGHITWAWIKWFQGIQQTINSAFDQQGNFDGNLGVDVSIVSRPVTLLTILQNIDDTGVVTAAGIDFARPYLNKDTDHINDGLGNPLAGGRVAYAAMVGSGPHAGQILVFDGSTWQPHAKATTIPKAAHEWLDSYNDATGTFTASQPSFVDILGTISPSQLPVATTSTVGVVKPDGTTITVDPDGTVHLANSGVSAGTYTNATVTVNAQGQVTAASSGSAGSSSYAPIQILQKANGSGNGPSVAFPSANLVGSAIVVMGGGFSGTPSCSDSQGNTYTTYGASAFSAMFVALNVKAGANTVTVSGMSGNVSIYELSNVAQVEASTSASASSVSTLGTGSASSAYPFEFVLMTAFSTAGTATNANSWGTLQSFSSIFGFSVDFATTIAAAGSISNTANFAGSGNVYTGFVILRPIINLPNPELPATAGKVLTANGASAPPSFQTPAFASLTTTGTTGGATLSGGVLNIPVYSAGAGYSPSLLALPPVLASWTWVNQGGATADNNNNFIYMNAPASASFSLRMLEVALSSTTFTYSVTFRPMIEIANSLAAGIGLRESSSGKVIFFYFASFGSGGALRIGVNKYTNPTTYSSTLVDVASPMFSGNVCFQIKQDGTNRTFKWGTDDGGHFPIQIASELQSTFMTPDQAVLIVDSETASWNATATFNGMSLTYP